MANITLRDHPDSLPVVMFLLRKVRERSNAQASGAPCVPPGTVIRCDGVDSDNPGTKDRSALFVAFPYLAASKIKPGSTSHMESLHSPSSLAQFAYNHDPASDQQFYSKVDGVDAGRYLRVCHQWVLVLESSEETSPTI